MKDFQEWKIEKRIENSKIISLSKEEFLETFISYFSSDQINESVETSRYSIEINYRTTAKETLDAYAKLCLGYVSAALKKQGYHTRHVYDESPIRLIVSNRNWDDGEWASVITWHPNHNCFVISKGYYNKERRSVNIQHSQKCTGQSASEITKDVHNLMNHLKSQPNKHVEKLKPVSLKRGPKS